MERIDSIDDPRVSAYRNLRDRTLRGESIFLAEGRLLVERLLVSRFETESVFVAEEYAADLSHSIGDRVPLYVGTRRVMMEVVGFNFHRGVLAVARRGPPGTLDEMLSTVAERPALRLVIGPKITQPENLGLIFRTAAGFGVDGLVLGPQCCDPLSRRALRLSMGGVLRVPFITSIDLAADLQRLKAQWGVELVATVLSPDAARLDVFRWPSSAAVLFGNEFEGLDAEWVAFCDHRLTIPMQPGTDSLNLGVAAGVFLYEMTRGAQ